MSDSANWYSWLFKIGPKYYIASLFTLNRFYSSNSYLLLKFSYGLFKISLLV